MEEDVRSTYLLAFGRRADTEGCGPVHGVVQGDEAQNTAETVKDGDCGHAQDPQPDLVGRATDDEESGDNGDCESRGPGQRVETPSAGGAEGPVKPLLLNQAQGTDGKLEIGGTTPDGGDDGEDDPAGDVAGVVHAVVEGDGDGGGIDEDEEEEEAEAPTLLAVVPGEGQLGQQVRVVVVILLERLGAALPLLASGGPGVVVGFGPGP